MAINKILNHPDKEDIIKWLTSGESVRGVESRIKGKYPNNKRLWISSVTIQNFRKEKLQLDGKVLQDIQEVGKAQQQQIREQTEQKQLEASLAYKNKLNEIVDVKLDVARKILELDAVIGSRMEYWYNAIASGDATAAQGDRQLQQFMDRQMALLGQYKKFVEGIADKTFDYNVNVTVMNDQITIMRDAIRECIAEFEPDIAMRFMEKLNNKLQNTFYKELPATTNVKEIKEVKFETFEDLVKNDQIF